MTGTVYVSVALYLISSSNLIYSHLTVNINYGGKEDGVSTCVSKEDTTYYCKHRVLIVSGNTHNIPNEQITASTIWSDGYEAYRARLFNTVGVAAWVPKDNLPDPWIQFDLGRAWTVLAVVTRGRHDTDQFVTSYKVTYAPTTQQHWKVATYRPAPEIAPVDPTIFPGNHDRDTLKVNYIDEPIRARYVRIYPVTANQIHRSLRADLIGCFHDK